MPFFMSQWIYHDKEVRALLDHPQDRVKIVAAAMEAERSVRRPARGQSGRGVRDCGLDFRLSSRLHDYGCVHCTGIFIVPAAADYPGKRTLPDSLESVRRDDKGTGASDNCVAGELNK